jgi:tetratricopeptide (TPR) repeat protein
MKICPVCRAKYDGTKKFCRTDGTPLISENAMSPETIARRSSFESRIGQDPGNPSLLADYAEYLATVGLKDEALLQFHFSIEREDNPEIRSRLATLYAEKQDWNNAIKQIQILREADLNDVSLQRKSIDLLLSAGRPGDAADELATLCKRLPEDISLLRSYQGLLKNMGRKDEWVAVSRAILELEPDDLGTWSLLGERYCNDDREAEALEAYREVFRLDPNDPRAALALGVAWHNTGIKTDITALGKAIPLLKHAAASRELSESGRMRALLYLASAWIKTGQRLSTAVESLNPVVDSKSIRLTQEKELIANCFEILGDIAVHDGRESDAIGFFSRAMSIVDSVGLAEKPAALFHLRGDTWTARRSCREKPGPKRFPLCRSIIRRPMSPMRQSSAAWIPSSCRRFWPVASRKMMPRNSSSKGC